MIWWAPRLLTASVAAAVGAGLGHVIGQQVGWPLAGALVGMGLATLGLAGLDAWLGARLLRWLSSDLQAAAPPLPGMWGEVALRIERALRQRERETDHERQRLTEFLAAIEASPNGVVLLDAGSQIAWCSRAAADHLGIDPARDLRQPVTNLVRMPAFVAHLQEESTSAPVQVETSAGRRVLSILVRPYGQGQRLVLTQDITERERADAMRRDFVANVSHEIRTPLTVLAGFVETMVNLPLTEVERQRVLSLMTQQTQRMQALIADLLVLARLEGSPRPQIDAWFDLARLVVAVEAEAHALSNGQHHLSFDWAAPGVEVAGSLAELQSALTNLVANAIRYTPAGGSISVRAQRMVDGAGLTLDVEDTGPGVAAEHLPRLTERFYRVDTSRSRDTGGTGLGLAIVKHVVQRHGGELRIRSELGRGSQFQIVLPGTRVRSRALEPAQSTVVASR